MGREWKTVEEDCKYSQVTLPLGMHEVWRVVMQENTEIVHAAVYPLCLTSGTPVYS